MAPQFDEDFLQPANIYLVGDFDIAFEVEANFAFAYAVEGILVGEERCPMPSVVYWPGSKPIIPPMPRAICSKAFSAPWRNCSWSSV